MTGPTLPFAQFTGEPFYCLTGMRNGRTRERGIPRVKFALSELLFTWSWKDPIGKVTIYDAFKEACSAAEIDDFRFHDLET